MAAMSATVLSVAFLLASLVGVDRDAPGWFTGVCLAVAIITALTVISAIAADTQASAAERRSTRRIASPPSDN